MEKGFTVCKKSHLAQKEPVVPGLKKAPTRNERRKLAKKTTGAPPSFADAASASALKKAEDKTKSVTAEKVKLEKELAALKVAKPASMDVDEAEGQGEAHPLEEPDIVSALAESKVVIEKAIAAAL